MTGSALLYGCLLLSNAGSLLLPGSNLTNLIVLGHLHLTGGQFVARMWLPWLAAVLVTAAVVAIGERRSLRDRAVPAAPARRSGARRAARRSAAGRLASGGPVAAEPVLGWPRCWSRRLPSSCWPAGRPGARSASRRWASGWPSAG